MLGSSLTAFGFRGQLLEASLAETLGRPAVVFNLGVYGAEERSTCYICIPYERKCSMCSFPRSATPATASLRQTVTLSFLICWEDDLAVVAPVDEVRVPARCLLLPARYPKHDRPPSASHHPTPHAAVPRFQDPYYPQPEPRQAFRKTVTLSPLSRSSTPIMSLSAPSNDPAQQPPLGQDTMPRTDVMGGGLLQWIVRRCLLSHIDSKPLSLSNHPVPDRGIATIDAALLPAARLVRPGTLTGG
jgi:hypothetical protein